MCVGIELIISVITGTLFIISEVLPYVKKKFNIKCFNDCEEDINAVHQLVNIGIKRIKTKRNIES